MGGKVWSDREEKHFWRVAMSQSAKRGGADRAKPEKSWEDLARDMQRALGEDARRKYSGTMLFEHYFQNIESRRTSPNAILYVREYLKKLGNLHHSIDKSGPGRRRGRASKKKDANSVDEEQRPLPIVTPDHAANETILTAASLTAASVSSNESSTSTPPLYPYPSFPGPMNFSRRATISTSASGGESEESLFVDGNDSGLEEGELRD